jgi:hypothetical protein
VQSTYDAVRALGALAVDTTSAAAGVVCARVHGGGSREDVAEMHEVRGAGEDRGRIAGREMAWVGDPLALSKSQERGADGGKR